MTLTDADLAAIQALINGCEGPIRYVSERDEAIARHFKAIGRAEAIADAARLRDAGLTLLDIWDDGDKHPDARCYVPGSFRKEVELFRAAIDHALG